MPSDDLAASVAGWIERNWSLDLPLGEWWRRLFESGYGFPGWPAGLGGFGASAAEQAAVTTAIAGAGVIAPPGGVGSKMAAPTLLRHAGDDQLLRFLPPIGRGEVRWCQLFSEPGAGSDLAGLTTHAEIDGDELVVSGQKVWSSGAEVSDWGMLLCRTDRRVPKRDGITFVLIDMRQPGIEVRPVRQMNGDAQFCEVFLTEARAQRADVVGGLGGGWGVARTTLAFERAAAAEGQRRGLVVIDVARPRQLDRRVGDLLAMRRSGTEEPARLRPLLDWPTMRALAEQHRVTDQPVRRDQLMHFYVRSEVHRLNGRRLRAAGSAGGALDGPLMKLSLAMLAHHSRDVSLSVLGAEGMLTGASGEAELAPVQRAALSSFVPSIGGGTNEIQRTLIAERSLGLPREPDHRTPS
jgi:alkylation response protein AidB-like acyl-CoA dehydrogenase